MGFLQLQHDAANVAQARPGFEKVGWQKLHSPTSHERPGRNEFTEV